MAVVTTRIPVAVGVEMIDAVMLMANECRDLPALKDRLLEMRLAITDAATVADLM